MDGTPMLETTMSPSPMEDMTSDIASIRVRAGSSNGESAWRTLPRLLGGYSWGRRLEPPHSSGLIRTTFIADPENASSMASPTRWMSSAFSTTRHPMPYTERSSGMRELNGIWASIFSDSVPLQLARTNRGSP